MNFITGYQITDKGYYSGKIQIRENPRKKGDYRYNTKCVILTPPPVVGKNEIPKWTGNEWIIEPDYRGDWYNKVNAEIVRIFNIGEIIDTEKYTNVPPPGFTPAEYFNDTTGKWAENKELTAARDYRVKAKELTKKLNDLDVKKMRYLIEKEKGDLSGKKYFDQYEEETLALRAQLKELIDGGA